MNFIPVEIKRRFVGLFDRSLGWGPALAKKGLRGLRVEPVGGVEGLRIKERDTVVLFLSRLRYQFTHGLYPKHLADEVEQVVAFTRHELFPNGGEVPYFLGEVQQRADVLHVPVFFLSPGEDPRAGFDGIAQTRRLVATPAALHYPALFPRGDGDVVLAVPLQEGQREVALYRGWKLIDCFLLTEDLMNSFGAYLDRLRPYRRFLLGEDEEMMRMGFQPLRPREPVAVAILKGAVKAGEIIGWPAALSTRTNPVLFAYGGLLLVVLLYAGVCLSLKGRYDELLQRDRALKAEVARLEARLRPIERLRAEVERLQAIRAKLEEARGERFSPQEVLRTLTRVTPRDIWLNRFELKGRELLIEGFAPSADRYAALLKGVPDFAEVKFASSVRRDRKTGLERFSIRVVMR